MKQRPPKRLIQLVPGLALPDYMMFLLEYCDPTGHTRKAVEAGHLLRVDYHPPYLQFQCRNVEQIVEKARRRGLRVYRGKRHITITDGIFRARIYLDRKKDHIDSGKHQQDR
ncbi:MAG: hypothetical protein GSR72_07425 [Desulfurococcales archaeon]|nr:hypothetical protein [Desulfurococcales archaeon]MEB3789703.1 hypothetical protein [Desulfurococcales archaeon]